MGCGGGVSQVKVREIRTPVRLGGVMRLIPTRGEKCVWMGREINLQRG